MDAAHVKSKGSGGPDAWINLVPLCRQHHSEQHQSGFQAMIKKFPLLKAFLRKKGWKWEGQGREWRLWNPKLEPGSDWSTEYDFFK